MARGHGPEHEGGTPAVGSKQVDCVGLRGSREMDEGGGCRGGSWGPCGVAGVGRQRGSCAELIDLFLRRFRSSGYRNVRHS